MITEPETFGVLIRRQRAAQRMPLEALAAASGLSASYISKIECGLLRPPSDAKILALARAMDCNPDDLLARAGRVHPDLVAILAANPIELGWVLRAIQHWPLAAIGELVRVVREKTGMPQKPILKFVERHPGDDGLSDTKK